MRHRQLGLVLHQLHAQVRDRARAGAGVVQLAGVGLGVLDEFGKRAHRQIGVDQQHIGQAVDQRDRREILDGVIGQIGVDGGVDHMRALRGDDQRVAVGPGLGHVDRAHGAAGAALVVDQHRNAQLAAQAVGDQPARVVHRAAGRERHDQRDRLRRVCGLGMRSRQRCQGSGRGQAYEFASVEVHVCLDEEGAMLRTPAGADKRQFHPTR